MPCRWSGTPPNVRLELWPQQSLNAPGFVWVIGTTATLMAVPLIAVLGSPVLWGVLPFLLAALGGLWLALRRNVAAGHMREVLLIAPDRVELTRTEPDGRARHWQAHPHWVRLQRRADGPVPQYLTLEGGPRPVEIGAFLSEAEREALAPALRAALERVRPS